MPNVVTDFNLANDTDTQAELVAQLPAALRADLGAIDMDGPVGASFVVNAEGGDAIAVDVTLVDMNSAAMTEPCMVNCYLADDATGLTPTAAVPSASGVVSVGAEVFQYIAQGGWFIVSDATGEFTLTLGEAGAGTWYLVVVMPDGTLVISGAITFA